MVPQAAPDLLTASLLIITVGVLLFRNVGPLPMVLGGAVLGVFSKTEIWVRVRGSRAEGGRQWSAYPGSRISWLVLT